MSSAHRESHGRGDDGSASGLGHLRNFTMTNAATTEDSTTSSNASAQPQPPSSHFPSLEEAESLASPAGPGENSANLGYTGQQGLRSPKPNRRRPNQAQRRQMMSQLTITPDLQPQLPATYQPRSTSTYQSHTVVNSHPQSWSVPKQSDLPRSHGSWSGLEQDHASNATGHLNSSPRTHSTPSALHATRQTTDSFCDYRRPYSRLEEAARQSNLLDMLCCQVLSSSEIERSGIAEKESFRQRIESISREVIARYEQEQNGCQNFPPLSVELKCFGSLSSGFATKASDMDLGLLSPLSKVQPDAPASPIPRLLEKALLDAGFGARLLSRTRVPIIKLCESPLEKLRQSLLAKREKWENGVENEPHTDAGDEHDNEGPSHGHDEPAVGLPTSTNVISSVEFEVLYGDAGEALRFRLQQEAKHSLSAYYGLAKRILRRAGGRDITISNCRDFTAMDWAILNRVCQAFVQGLSNSSLRERVNVSFNRCLLGVYTQVEGEQILQAWKTWLVTELIQAGPQDEHTLNLWSMLQSRAILDVDPVSYTKELQLALGKIKKIPAIQLLLLEQGQQETPSQYYTRTQDIIHNLKTHAEELPYIARRAIVGQYIFGIYDGEVREKVKKYLEQFLEHSDLEAVGCRHKSLHLARELEEALDKDLYDATYAADIKLYIGLLRSPLRETAKGPNTHCFIVPVPIELSALLKRMRTLKPPQMTTPKYSRDKYHDPLEFPKESVGVQCDINFSAHLALQNTLLLRCYSHTDPRVRPIVLFIKHWAKVRGINSGYRGTLSSYGYVLMVLHYLVNVAYPFVCPNLQQLAPIPPFHLSPAEMESTVMCKGYNVQFWRNEKDILQLALTNQLNHNNESVGQLLRGFFEYFAQRGKVGNGLSTGFDWGRDVISLRMHGGLLTKQEKGWTGSKTVYGVQKPDADAGQSASRDSSGNIDNSAQVKPAHSDRKIGDVREVRLRYLLAIEDPFEWDHNVARTVTHNGIVSIRDEFRRAWRIIREAGNGNPQENLLQDVNEVDESSAAFRQLLTDIHGPEVLVDTHA